MRPEFVNYAKRAKRVDVRKLKDNIWKGLDIVVKKEPAPDADESMVRRAIWVIALHILKNFCAQEVDDDGATPTDPSESRQFSQVISGLQRSYPRDKMEEISTSFCFICLLHLANEQGLKLESDINGVVPMDDPIEEDMVEDDVEQTKGDEKKIGNIWDIKVCCLSVFYVSILTESVYTRRFIVTRMRPSQPKPRSAATVSREVLEPQCYIATAMSSAPAHTLWSALDTLL